MLTRTIALWVVLSAIAFAQSKMPGAGAGPPSSAGSNNDSRDTGNERPLELKSINDVLRDSPRLSANLQSMLPADATPQQACSGFKTLEQCVTTVHAAQNLKLSFADLKAKTTGKGSIKLEKAIEQMAAGSSGKDEAKKAKKQASEDMKGVNLFG